MKTDCENKSRDTAVHRHVELSTTDGGNTDKNTLEINEDANHRAENTVWLLGKIWRSI